MSHNRFWAMGLALALLSGNLVFGQSFPGSPVDPKSLDQVLKGYYDGQTLVVVAPKLRAGEYQKQALGGTPKAGLVMYHFHDSLNPIPDGYRKYGSITSTKINRLEKIDTRTFLELSSGLNVSELRKGEEVRVDKFYIRNNNAVELFLEPLGLSHLENLDVTKASGRSRTSIRGGQQSTTLRVAGFGLRAIFAFDEDRIFKTGDAKAIVEEIGKYFLPAAEAEGRLTQEKNIAISIGMSEADLIEKLGEPLRSVTVGTDKILRYPDLKITIKNGAVASVDIE